MENERQRSVKMTFELLRSRIQKDQWSRRNTKKINNVEQLRQKEKCKKSQFDIGWWKLEVNEDQWVHDILLIKKQGAGRIKIDDRN